MFTIFFPSVPYFFFSHLCSKDAVILPWVVSLFTKLLPPNSEATPTDTTALLKVALQLLGNTCAGYPEGQEKVWQCCFPQHFRYNVSCMHAYLIPVGRSLPGVNIRYFCQLLSLVKM